MSFFAGIVSNVLIGLLSAIGGWLVRHFQEMAKDAAQAKADAAQEAAAIQALKDAKTKEEIDNAAKAISGQL